jgi:hypothetical protein
MYEINLYTLLGAGVVGGHVWKLVIQLLLKVSEHATVVQTGPYFGLWVFLVSSVL